MKKTMEVSTKIVMKSADELIQMLEDLQREAAMPISCSQASAVSDSLAIDNNPLMLACEANANFDWKFDECEELMKTKEDLLDFTTFGATDLAFASTVVMSPPTSTHEKENIDTQNKEQSESMQAIALEAEADVDSPDLDTEVHSIIQEIFEPSSQNMDVLEQKKIQAIEEWLMMANSSQGNEYLSQESVAKESNEVEISSTVVEVEVADPPSPDVIIEPDVSQIVALPDATEDERSVAASSRLRRKRTRDYRDASSPEREPTPKRRSAHKGDKKRDQNKEAAKRYRDRKKKESSEFKSQCDELEQKNRESLIQIQDMLKERKVYIELWKSLASTKTNPNFNITFPDWI